MSIAVLLSIKPEFADAIFDGSKRFEYRKAIYRDPRVSKIYVYASAPISMVIGEFEVDEVIESAPNKLWESTKTASGITREYFRSYFAGRTIGYAIRVGTTALYDMPKPLRVMFNLSHPPQSFRYVPTNSLAA